MQKCPERTVLHGRHNCIRHSVHLEMDYTASTVVARLDSSPVFVREVPKHIRRHMKLSWSRDSARDKGFLMFGDVTENKRIFKGL